MFSYTFSILLLPIMCYYFLKKKKDLLMPLCYLFSTQK